jgi:PIN like domain
MGEQRMETSLGENEVTPSGPESEAEKANVKGNVTERKRSEPKPPAGIDPFLLDRIYPEAHRVFQPTEELAPKSNTVVIALDTNALLLPYSLGKGDLSALATVYSQFAQEERLFLPERVAREFIKNRDRKLAEMAHAIDDRVSKMAGWDAKVTPLLLDGFSERDALAASGDSLEVATKKYLELLRHLAAHVRSWRGNDPVTTLYARLFTKERMIGPGETPEKIIEELDYGLRNQVPPGYKDSSKDDRGIGDIVIWMSLLNLGRTMRRDLIFVTGEQKADWFVRSGNRPVYPRPELVEAYRYASGGRSLRLSSLHELLKEMSAPHTLVTDVEVAEATANSAIQAASSAGIGAFASSAYTTVSGRQREFEYRQDDDQRDGYIGDNEAPSSPEEAELVLRLNHLEEELRRVRGAIAQITHDDWNTSLSLPWNRAAHGLRSQEISLSRDISELRRRLGDLPRLERKGAY